MDASLDDLYREIILDHNRNPRNYGALNEGNIVEIEEFNPLCGDKIVLYLQSDKEIIVNVHFTGEGCSISQASASIMTDLMIGKKINEADELLDKFRLYMTDLNNSEPDVNLGDIDAFQGVKKFPARVKCAGLAWNSLGKALQELNS
ncbi:MAG: SUF system NifU family Fe-S cluster assembly protein [Dehalococcoidia bacterium]|nr:SUF system NifU family Fe-S cluster assembly protein [Dehalococcoidia bacterium]